MYLIKKPSSIKKRKRVCRGISAGQGKTGGRGYNGQLSRSGSRKRPWFEGGQMPLQRRVPKRGFTNIFQKNYQLVNLAQLNKLKEELITAEVLKDKGLIKKVNGLVKILGNGNIDRAVKIEANSFSQGALDKIKKAGGEVTLKEAVSKSQPKSVQSASEKK